MYTITGRRPDNAGVNTLRLRQFSLSVCSDNAMRSGRPPPKYSPITGPRKMFPGPCTQRGPFAVQSRSPIQFPAFAGGRNRADPSVGPAYGIPLKIATPLKVYPRTLPAFVSADRDVP